MLCGSGQAMLLPIAQWRWFLRRWAEAGFFSVGV